MLLHRRRPLLDLSCAFGFRHGSQFGRIKRIASPPAGKILAIEERREFGGRLILGIRPAALRTNPSYAVADDFGLFCG